MDDVPTAGSDNLVKSGGVVKHLTDNFGYTVNPEDWELVGNCSINGEGIWIAGNTYESKSFDATELRNTTLTVKANDIGNAIISFVESINYPSAPVFATGETGRHVISVSTSAELIVPVDANYAVVTTKNDNQDRTPLIWGEFTKFQAIEHPDSEPTFGSHNTVKSGGVFKTISENFGYYTNAENWNLIGNCVITQFGQWTTDDSKESKSFSVEQIRGIELTVKANNTGNANISFLKSIGYPSNPEFATGETGRHVIPIGTSEKLIVPNDAVYAVVATKIDYQDRTPQVYSINGQFAKIKNEFPIINDNTGLGTYNKTWSANKLFNANQILNMFSTACANEIGSYREYDNKALSPVGNVVEDSYFKIVAFCCIRQDTTISIVNPNLRTIRVFILNAFTGITVISASDASSQTISLDSYNSDYTNNIVLVSLRKTATMYVDGIVPAANIALDNIGDTIYRTTLRTISGKRIEPTTGEISDNADFNLNYFSTESDTFTISFSTVQSGRTIRVFAFKNGVFLGQIHNETPTTAIDIDINFPHYGTLFVVQCHKNNVFTISNLVTEDGLSESIKKLSVNSNNITYLIDTYLNKGKVLYSAHRGLRTVAPENSIPAYEAAGRAGFDFLNLAQLRQSADGTWYVMHDTTIDRTTDGTGAIKNLTDEYLQTVHIDTGVNVEQYTPDELVIPTLEKAIQIARKYGMKLYFRIASITGNSYQADKDAWDSFITIIRKYRCEGMLFGGNALTDLLPLHRDLGLDWCINYDVYSSEAVYQQIADYVNAGIKNATIFTTSAILTDAHIAAAREHGFKVMVHLTSDNTTKAQCLEWSNKGVDIIGGVVNYDLSEN